MQCDCKRVQVSSDNADISKLEEPHNESLMYEELLTGLSEEEVDALLSCQFPDLLGRKK